MGVSNEHDVNTDMNLKSLEASTAEVTLNDLIFSMVQSLFSVRVCYGLAKRS